MSISIVAALCVVLRGLAQIFLLRTAMAGLVVLCGLLLASPALGVAAVLGSACGSGLAVLRRQPLEGVRQGLHGYNAALALMAVRAFFEPSVAAACVAAAMLALTNLLQQAGRRWSVPVYTAPFLLSAWGAMAVAPSLGLQPALASTTATGELVEGVVHGVAQVVFLQSVPAGMCLLLAIALESRRLALQALMASAWGLLIGQLVDMPNAALAAGLAGFNAVLCMLALGRHGRPVPALVAASGATLLSLAAQRVGIPALTGPFIFCTWVALWHSRLDKP